MAVPSFKEETWERAEGGGGRSRVLTQGTVFEQAGVNFSHVFGDKMPGSATAHRPELAGRGFRGDGRVIGYSPAKPTCADQSC